MTGMVVAKWGETQSAERRTPQIGEQREEAEQETKDEEACSGRWSILNAVD